MIEQPSEQAGRREVRILVVDDQVAFRRAAALLISVTPGATLVGEATTGEQAVELARRLRPDLVLMDVRLPGIDGPEATRRILADAPATRVVLVSTYEQADLTGDLDRCGASGFVRKQDVDGGVLLAS